MRGGRLIAVAVAALSLAGSPSANAAEPSLATPAEVVAMVRGAALFLSQKGESGVAAFDRADGPWVFKDSYVFVYDCRRDLMLAHPLRPDMVGRPVRQITDNNGKLIFADLCRMGADPRGGWVDYVWTRPGEGRLSRKVSFTLGAEIAFTTGIQVAAGLYDDQTPITSLLDLSDRMADPSRLPPP